MIRGRPLSEMLKQLMRSAEKLVRNDDASSATRAPAGRAVKSNPRSAIAAAATIAVVTVIAIAAATVAVATAAVAVIRAPNHPKPPNSCNRAAA